MSWIYDKKIIDSIEGFPEDCVGFVYEILHKPSGLKYIGKKILRNKVKYPPLKGKKRKRVFYKESNWKEYYGSSLKFKQLVTESKNLKEDFERHILILCQNKAQMNYYEQKFQMDKNVLTTTIPSVVR